MFSATGSSAPPLDNKSAGEAGKKEGSRRSAPSIPSKMSSVLWIYYSSQILLFGAEFTQVYANQAGRRVQPSEYAVPIEQMEVERPRGTKR